MRLICDYDRKLMQVSILPSIVTCIPCIPMHNTYFIEMLIELLVIFKLDTG